MKASLIPGFVVLTALIGSAGADELKPPPIRDGLWQSRVTQTQQGKTIFDFSTKICYSKDYSNEMQALGAEAIKKNECTSVVSQPAANTLVEESRCAKGANAGSVTKSTYTYQGDTANHMEMHIQGGKSDSVMVTDMKYLSSCPAGMKPGDSINLTQKK